MSANDPQPAERDLVSPRLIVTRDDVDGLASALVLREATGPADVRVCGTRADRLDEILARVDETRCAQIWIAGLAPTPEHRDALAFQQMRLVNGNPWIAWLDHHRWPFEKRPWFRQLSKVTIINDRRRAAFEICAAACFPVPRPEPVLAVCAAAYRMPAPEAFGLSRLWAKMKSLSGDDPDAHRAAQSWLAGFTPAREAIAALVAPDPSDLARVPGDRIAVVAGPHGIAIVQIDLRDGLLGDLSRARRLDLLIDAQRSRGAQGAVLLPTPDRALVGASEYRLPGGAARVAETFAARIAEERGTAQVRSIRFGDERAPLEVAPFLAALEPARAARFDPDSPEGLYAAGTADLYEGRPDLARQRLARALDAYIARQDLFPAEIPRRVAGIPPWPLRAETALYCLRQ